MLKVFNAIKNFVKKHKKLSVLLLGIVIVVCLVLGVVTKKTNSAGPNSAADAASFTTSVQKMDIQNSVSVTGTLAAKDTVSVTSTLSGVKVKAVNYEVGDYVDEGTVVAEFDGDDLEEKVADLNLSSQISNMRSAHSIEGYEEQIKELQEYLDKYAGAYNNAVSLRDSYESNKDNASFMERYNREEQATGGLENYISNYESKQDQLEEAQFNLEIAKLEQQQTKNSQNDSYESAYQSIEDAQVKAPISGYITAINVEEGNNYAQGSTVFTISNTNVFVVEATVDEYDISSLEKGMDCVVKFDATGDTEFKGTLTYVAIAPTTSSSSAMGSSSSSASYAIKIELSDTDEKLRAGMTAKASVILESVDNVLAVPYDCVGTDKDGSSYVTVVDGDKETKVTVTRGMENDYYVEIQSSEISEGTKVKATASSASKDFSLSEDFEIMGEVPDDISPVGDFNGTGGHGGFGGGPGGN